MAERFLRERYGAELMDHRIYGICSDGDLMEGSARRRPRSPATSAWAASSTSTTTTGSRSTARPISPSPARTSRRDSAPTAGRRSRSRTPTTWRRWRRRCGRPRSRAPVADQGALGHRLALTEQGRHRRCARLTARRERRGRRSSPSASTRRRRSRFPRRLEPLRGGRGAEGTRIAPGRDAWRGWRGAEPGAAAEWDAAWAGRPSGEVGPLLPGFEGPKSSTRSASGKVMQAFADLVPTMVGGSADLAGSTKTEFADDPAYTRDAAGRNVHWGVREHAMAPRSTGLRCTGGSSGRTGRPSWLLRLHAPGDQALGDHGSGGRLGLLARLDRGRGGRPDPPADRALCGAAGDPRPHGDPSRRRRRDC